MNWAGNLITNTPDAELFVAAARFLKTNFFYPNVTYVEFPLREGDWPSGSRFGALADRGVRLARRLTYPRLLKARIGAVDIVHSHFATAGWHFRQFVQPLGARHVVSFYGYDYEKVPQSHPAWRDRYRILFDHADMFLCEGAHGAEALCSLGAPADKVRVCALGILPERITPVRRRKDSKALKLLQVATYAEKKGQVYALRAFAMACRDCPNMQLVFVGSTRDAQGAEIMESLRNESDAAGISDRVSFLPAIPYDSLYELFTEFHVFIHPSTYSKDRDCEGGAPIVLLDAQATGMPVIATRHCDIPGEVVHGTTGLLSAERDVDTLASYIRRFYDMDQAEYDRFAQSARKHVEAAFDVKGNAKQLRGLYAEVCASPRPIRPGTTAVGRRARATRRSAAS
jgi:colanic acid/amylovoran biosynthesis glycosyltransferase